MDLTPNPDNTIREKLAVGILALVRGKGERRRPKRLATDPRLVNSDQSRNLGTSVRGTVSV
jgi:hypothetical protein